MALVLKDRVLETCTSPGTGTITLLGAVTGYQAFSTVGNGNTCYYAIADQNGANWEVGIGTYSSGTLARTTVLSSSNAGSLTNFSTGSQNVFLTYPSERSVNLSSAALTSGRVTFATTDGLLSDSSGLTFDGTIFQVKTGNTAVTQFRIAHSTAANFYADYNEKGDLTVNRNSWSAGVTTVFSTTSATATYTGDLAGGFSFSPRGNLAVTIAGNGLVGIGTSSPAYKLDIKGGIGNQARFDNAGEQYTQIYWANNGTSKGAMWIDNTNSLFTMYGYTGMAVNFYTNATERMRIDSSGNLSVGTTSAFARVTTSTSAGSAGQVNGQIAMTHASATTGYYISTIRGASTNEPEGLTFKENATERMRIDSSGNVGIGTSSPVSKLDVTGQVTATGGIFKANGSPSLSAATAGEAILAPESGLGALLYGRGTTYDVTIGQRSTAVALGVLAGTNNVTFPGLVGIGTSSPSAKLNVVGGVTFQNSTLEFGNVTTSANQFVLQYMASGNGYYSYMGVNGSGAGVIDISGISDNAVYYGSRSNVPLQFLTNNTIRATFDTSGNLGIGTSSPVSRLTVEPQSGSANTLTIRKTGVTSFASLGAYSDANGPAYFLGANLSFTSGGSASRPDTGYAAWNISMDSRTTNTAMLFEYYNTAGTYSERMRLDASGNLLVGTTSANETSGTGGRFGADGYVRSTRAQTTDASSTLDVYSTGASAFRFYVGMGGTVFATSIVISAISDQRLKENIRDIETGLSTIMALKPRRFDWKEGKGQDKKNVAGFIAQEFEDVFPECVSTAKAGEDGIEYKNINHETLIPTLVKAIQEQQALIESLTTRLTALESK